MIGLDSNVLLRLLTKDEPAQAELARDLVAASGPGRRAHVSVIVLCELVWVLGRAMKYRRADIAVMLDALLHSPHLSIEDAAAVREAVERFRRGADFADALIGLRNRDSGCAATLTFDRDASGQPEFRLLTATSLREML
ncbi:MAG: PIN domain-containing protein [Alphaproteobacteria bacterium]